MSSGKGIGMFVKAAGITFVCVNPKKLLNMSCDGCAFFTGLFASCCDVDQCANGIFIPEPTPHNLMTYRLLND